MIRNKLILGFIVVFLLIHTTFAYDSVEIAGFSYGVREGDILFGHSSIKTDLGADTL